MEYDTDIQQNWNKISSNSKKIGFREGANDGRESVFQNQFDEGYKEGFKNGFAAGLYKGTLKTASLQSRSNHSEELLSKTKSGWCQICNNSENQTKEEMVKNQKIYSSNLLKELYSKYGNISTNLPNKID